MIQYILHWFSVFIILSIVLFFVIYSCFNTMLFFFLITFQLSGLPLELKVKFQINMAMRDVSNMAHVEKFSDIVIPMVWFEIVSAISFFFIFCYLKSKNYCGVFNWKPFSFSPIPGTSRASRLAEKSLQSLPEHSAGCRNGGPVVPSRCRSRITLDCRHSCLPAAITESPTIA